jgi:hypothetical protein
MKRMILVLAVAALMAVMLVAMAAPAFAVGLGPAPWGAKDIAGPSLGQELALCNQDLHPVNPLFHCHVNPAQPFD